MAISCVQCGQRIGFFSKPVASIYCSASCQNAAAEEELQRETRRRLEAEHATNVQDPAEQPIPSAAVPTEASAAAPRSSAPVQSGVATSGALQMPCPKCGGQWDVVPGAGELGRSRGACRRCGFGADFVSLADCPNCRCASLVVRDDQEARCPRCKTRVRNMNLTA